MNLVINTSVCLSDFKRPKKQILISLALLRKEVCRANEASTKQGKNTATTTVQKGVNVFFVRVFCLSPAVLINGIGCVIENKGDTY